ncbi:hypothetical protein N9X93_01075 [Alphaproteobacteria bacterium]|nr:hypothetical protein [Alphaproteobacteria bacterium]
MLQYSESYSHFHNGKPMLVSVCENRRVDNLDADAKSKSFQVTLASYIARTSRAKKDALLADPAIREYLFEDDFLAEINLPDKKRLLRTGHSTSALSHARKRAVSDLTKLFKQIVRDNGRSAKSYRCELAAIVIATYGKVSSIPRNIWTRIETVFGHDIVQDPETVAYREQMATTDAENWFRHLADIDEIFTLARVDKSTLLQLTANSVRQGV